MYEGGERKGVWRPPGLRPLRVFGRVKGSAPPVSDNAGVKLRGGSLASYRSSPSGVR